MTNLLVLRTQNALTFTYNIKFPRLRVKILKKKTTSLLLGNTSLRLFVVTSDFQHKMCVNVFISSQYKHYTSRRPPI